MIPVFAFSQEEVEQFEMTPTGINGYVVVDYPGKTVDELFMAGKRWAEYTITKAEAAKKSEIVNEYLNYSIYYPGALLTEKGANAGFDAKLDIEFRVKNGKIRYDIQLLDVRSASGGGFSITGGFFNWSFYNNKGKIKSNMAYPLEEFNRLANKIVIEVSDYVEHDKDNTDW